MPPREKKLTPFTYVNAILKTGEKLTDMSGYASFIVNRALARSKAQMRAVTFVNNMARTMTAQMQFDYLRLECPNGYQRKWLRADEPDETILLFAKEMNLGLRDARDYWRTLPTNLQEELKLKLHGDDNDKGRTSEGGNTGDPSGK